MLCGADRPKNGVPRFLLRVGPDNAAEALAMPGVTPMQMAGRQMTGYVFVDATIVNGQIVQRNGTATGNLPGRLVRGTR